jgi:hypothetical protein
VQTVADNRQPPALTVAAFLKTRRNPCSSTTIPRFFLCALQPRLHARGSLEKRTRAKNLRTVGGCHVLPRS